MTFRHSLRSRIIFSFCLFGAVLGIVYAIAVYISLDMIDDHLIDNRLNEEVEYYINHYQRYNAYPRPTSPYITAYEGMEDMPLFVTDMIEGLDDGLYETYSDEEEYHIAIRKLQGQNKPLYLIYEVSALEFTEKRKLSIGLVLIAGVALIIGLGYWIGRLTSQKVIAPVVHLSELVNNFGPDNLPIVLSKTFFNDEVGILANALEQAMIRVETYVEREQRFSRYASHELRTPVTIIKGAVVLLKKIHIKEDDPAYRPLKRIERSVTNMENIIETLLWLSREEKANYLNQLLNAESAIREIIDQNRYLIGNKSLEIDLVTENDPQLSVPAPIFQILLTNLIRNAIQNTASGIIKVILKADRVAVSDTGSGMDPDELKRITQPHNHQDQKNTLGMGLEIVNRLCESLGWRLNIESEKNHGTTVELIFRTILA